MRASSLVVALACVGSAGVAHADSNDLHLHRLLDTTPDAVVRDAAGNVLGVTRSPAAEQRYRTLMSELGAALAVRVLEPADTLGLSGFDFSFLTSTIGVSSAKAAGDDPWAAAEKRPDGLSTVGFFARKGIWIPGPAFELGAGAVHLLASDVWALQAHAKLGLHEGFHGWPIPSLALRGGASRVLGTSELDLTIANLDLIGSKSFGLGGTVTLSPFLGWSYLWVITRGQVLDATPWCDALTPRASSDPATRCSAVPGGDLNANFTFRDQNVITRQRIFLGAKLKFYVAALTLEYAYFMSGGSSDPGQPGASAVADQASGQSSLSLALSAQF